MIDRQHGVVIIGCDSCDDTFDKGSDDFHETWAAAKEAGWKTRKLGKDWVHACPTCEVDA